LANRKTETVELLARYEAALQEIARRERRSEYSSIYAAPSEFARIAKTALRDKRG
jgi:hypothetical protein